MSEKEETIMTGRRKRRRSEEEWRRLQAEYETSGKTQEEYCQAAGIPLASFWKWRRRLKNQGAPQFIELNPERTTSRAELAKLEVELASGITLRIWS